MQTRGASAFECGCLWQHMNHSGNTKRKSLNWSILDSVGWVLHLEHQGSQRFDLLTLPHVISADNLIAKRKTSRASLASTHHLSTLAFGFHISHVIVGVRGLRYDWIQSRVSEIRRAYSVHIKLRCRPKEAKSPMMGSQIIPPVRPLEVVSVHLYNYEVLDSCR